MKFKQYSKGSTKYNKETIQLLDARERKLSYTPSESEQKIIDFLTRDSIEFDVEVPLRYLRNPKTGHHLYFDFWIPRWCLFVEFDGYHHFDRSRNDYWDIRKRDRIKDEYCKKFRFNLLRIPYWKDPLSELCNKIDELDGRTKTNV